MTKFTTNKKLKKKNWFLNFLAPDYFLRREDFLIKVFVNREKLNSPHISHYNLLCTWKVSNKHHWNLWEEVLQPLNSGLRYKNSWFLLHSLRGSAMFTADNLLHNLSVMNMSSDELHNVLLLDKVDIYRYQLLLSWLMALLNSTTSLLIISDRGVLMFQLP